MKGTTIVTKGMTIVMKGTTIGRGIEIVREDIETVLQKGIEDVMIATTTIKMVGITIAKGVDHPETTAIIVELLITS
ncbi:hypothetical protein Ciccas_004385 [Cichlidogyrus casuarinus]|uniref:Uncharacterized protein n=1 Tax=Cichlidogyrus casuarinus TaxID=1844966 RepID=A0ABD2QBQ5_9PLAT